MDTSKKIVISCPNCGKKVRIPESDSKLRINCPSCSTLFFYKNSFLGLSKGVVRLLAFGATGGFVGFVISEIFLHSVLVNNYFELLRQAYINFSNLGLCIGGFIGSAEGYIKKIKYRMWYGIKIGVILGGIGGAISGVIAQLLFTFLLNIDNANNNFFTHMMIRTFCWGIFGLLLGLSYGIKQNTIGDLKSGLISGLIGGVAGGLLFDPLSVLLPFNDGLISRALGYSVIGLSLGACIQFLQEKSVKNNNKDMYQPLTKKLPANLRLTD